MEPYSEPLAVTGNVVAETCQSCGRRPASRVTVRRHVGLFYLQRFVTVKAVACRACGRRLVRDFTLRTLVQGWWGLISFFFNWFVLAANAFAWLRLGRLNEPSVWTTEDVTAPSASFADAALEAEAASSKKRSWLVRGGIVPGVFFGGLVLLAIGAGAWDATHHDHEGPHGSPLTALELRHQIAGQMFLTDGGLRIWVESASCNGTGGNGHEVRYIHFRCHLVFDNGEAEDVLVHVQPDEFFFTSSRAGGA
jgi:hypothetical protein